MANSNLPASATKNKTVDFFTNLADPILNISQNVDDAVLGYFENITKDKEAGRTLAATVISTALNQGIDPMTVIDEFRRLRPEELNAYITVFLNLSRANTSLLAVGLQPQTNKYIQRAILA